MNARQALENWCISSEEHGADWAWEDWANTLQQALDHRDELLEALADLHRTAKCALSVLPSDWVFLRMLDEELDAAEQAMDRAESHLSGQDQ